MSRKSCFALNGCMIIVLFLAVVAGCGLGSSSGSDPVCGNGQCESDESCSNCPQDCTTGCATTRLCADPVFVTSDTDGG